MLRNQALAIEAFQSKWQMAGQEAHAFIAKIRSQSEDFARAELIAVQRFEDSLQRHYDGQFRWHVHALQDECRDQEDKLHKELQQALAQESKVCRDQLRQTLRHQACQEEYADEVSRRDQLRHMVAEQEDAVVRLEATSKHAFSHQYEEHAHNHQTLFQEFNGALKDEDNTVHALKQELANHKEQALAELEQARRDAEHMANVTRLVSADGLSAQPYATPTEKKIIQAVAAVAHAAPVSAHSLGLSLGSSAGNLNLRSRNKGSSATVFPVRRRHRTKTPPIAQQRVPSMAAVRRLVRSKGPPPQPEVHSQEQVMGQVISSVCFYLDYPFNKTQRTVWWRRWWSRFRRRWKRNSWRHWSRPTTAKAQARVTTSLDVVTKTGDVLSSMTERFAHEKRYLYGRKAPILLQHVLLIHLPDWLTRKTGVLGCTSSHTILFMCWQKFFPMRTQQGSTSWMSFTHCLSRCPSPGTYQFASWREDWMTKLVAADEVAMAVLMNAGKPLHTTDGIFMTEWVAFFQDPCRP